MNETGETDIDETTSKLQCDADGRAAELEEQVSTLQEKADKLQEQITVSLNLKKKSRLRYLCNNEYSNIIILMKLPAYQLYRIKLE